jgi:enamine deaminase RidA (YjgF/YER057c/UK114 family)
MLTPTKRGSFRQQFAEVLADMESVLKRQGRSLAVTAQTLFLQDAADQSVCEHMVREHFGGSLPITNYVHQPPCCGAAIAVEAWAIGGDAVKLERFSEYTIGIEYDGVRRIYCAGIKPNPACGGVYAQASDALHRLRAALTEARTDFYHVVRTWFYLGSITELEGDVQRYQELNRARTEYYRDVQFCCSLLKANAPRGVYPASTGIGTAGRDLVVGCVALETQRPDVFLLPLENPQQTPAYAYHPKYSSQSPKFSRAIALITGEHMTTWVSGTASIVNSESQHPDDIVKQTQQTVDNIERLISPENFNLHRMEGGATLKDMAKIRVYVKRPEDYRKCRAICERRFGNVPAVYAVADICRPELLVEIEGMVFSGTVNPLHRTGVCPV